MQNSKISFAERYIINVQTTDNTEHDTKMQGYIALLNKLQFVTM